MVDIIFSKFYAKIGNSIFVKSKIFKIEKARGKIHRWNSKIKWIHIIESEVDRIVRIVTLNKSSELNPATFIFLLDQSVSISG